MDGRLAAEEAILRTYWVSAESVWMMSARRWASPEFPVPLRTTRTATVGSVGITNSLRAMYCSTKPRTASRLSSSSRDLTDSCCT